MEEVIVRQKKCRANVQHKSGEEWEIKKPKSQKAKKAPVCWANKGSRAIFASQSGNIGLL
jgi:hypothetical protein